MTQAEQIISELKSRYQQSVDDLRQALLRYIDKGEIPKDSNAASGRFCYPQLVLEYHDSENASLPSLSFGRLNDSGTYYTTITRPEIFSDYLYEQLDLLVNHYDVDIRVETSNQQIPYAYVLDGIGNFDLGEITPRELARHFPSTDLADIGDELADIGDELADGIQLLPGEPRPLSLFDGLRTDYSLARLRHYTGTPPEHVQRFILFTNYHRYVDEFVIRACEQIGKGYYTALSGAGGLYTEQPDSDPNQLVADSAWRRHQMPAYHLIAPGGNGITLVNIGVGPSNAKTITDHLAVLRPEVWLMIGHCGGLRPSQRIGDYVLAHAYLRDDHIMDDVLPPEIPIPAIAEVQLGLARAAEQISGRTGADLKRRMRTGTVVTTDDRNWELKYSDSALRFSQSRAVGIDMESATIAAQGYRFRVPYGTMLCVSDKPLHGELKLPGQANRFYDEAIAAHMQIGMRACELLREEGGSLHSRKLRAFNEPPFR